MMVDLLYSLFSVTAARLCLNVEEYHRHMIFYSRSVLVMDTTGIWRFCLSHRLKPISIQGTHIFLILVEGVHNHDKSRRVFRNDWGLLTGENELIELCLEVEWWVLLTQAKPIFKTLKFSWKSLIVYTPELYFYIL